MEIKYDYQNGFVSITEKYDIPTVDDAPTFTSTEQTYSVDIDNLISVQNLKTFKYDILGGNSSRYLEVTYRTSRDKIKWSCDYKLEENIDNFPVVDPNDPLYVVLTFTRRGSSTIGKIVLLDWSIMGETQRTVVEDIGFANLQPGASLILKAPYIYKVFKIVNMEIISRYEIPETVTMKFRYSQDNSRTWSDWEFLTKENITTIPINPIRFFQIEYYIENNSNTSISINDINLIGEFQNVSKDYFKSNLFGVRENCYSMVLGGYYDTNGNFVPCDDCCDGMSSNPNITGNQAGSCHAEGSILPALTNDNKENLYNPYEQSAALNLLNKLSNDAQQMFGFSVQYFVTDPDKKGEDHVLNEYQLYNVVCSEMIKISVEGNNFPDSQIVMNQFDLNLFESMEVHITKDNFKTIFGPNRRPSKEDFIYFCDVNRMFQVDHAQQFRIFNNRAVYYKLILKKYNQKANVQAATFEIKNQMDELTKNSTIAELLGSEQNNAKKEIAQKPQFERLSRDKIRLSKNVNIEEEILENASNIISKNYYDLSSWINNNNIPTSGNDFGLPAIVYKNTPNEFKKSDNLSYVAWFNINNYMEDEIYNFINIYDLNNELGLKINLINDQIITTINKNNHVINIGSGNDGLEEGIWYCLLININQRKHILEAFIYKRNINEIFSPSTPVNYSWNIDLSEAENLALKERIEESARFSKTSKDIAENNKLAARLSSTNLKNIYKKQISISPDEYIIDIFEKDIKDVVPGDGYCKILSSDMKITNIRLFTDVIPVKQHNSILNQSILREDSKYLILADNANIKINLPYYPIYD